MNARFVTDLVDESPKVLVIMNDPSLRRWLAQLLQKYGLEAVTVSEAEAVPQLDDNRDHEASWYKIIWWTEISSESSVRADLTAVLSSRPEPVVVITSILTPITSEKPAFRAWQDILNYQRAFIELVQRDLPQVTLLVGQDLFFSVETFVPFSAFSYFLKQRILLDPDLALHPQTVKVFGKTILPNIMSPLPHQLLVQGKKMITSEILRKAQLVFHRQKDLLPSITTSPVTAQSLPPLPLVQNPEVESIMTFIQDWPSVPIVDHPVGDSVAAAKPLVGRVVAELPPSSVEVRPAPPAPKVASRLTRNPVSQPVTAAPPQQLQNSPTPSTDISMLAVATANPLPVRASTDIEDQVVELFEKYRSDHKVQRVEKLAGKKKVVARKGKHRKKLFWGGLAFAGTGFVVLMMGIIFLLSTWGLKSAVASTLSTQLTPSIKPSFLADRTPTLAKAVQVQMSIFNLVLDESFFGQASQLTQLANALTTVQTEKESWTTQTTLATRQLFGQTDGNSLENWNEAASTAKRLFESVSQAQAVLKSLHTPIFNSPEQQRTFEDQLVEFKRTLLPGQQLQPLLGTLLGENSRRNYVILFQNNQELRPTGGFIQAVAVVSVEQGEIINTQVFSVYELDSKVLGAVTPPSDLSQFLGEQQWYLRDSNWHPDFPTSSKQLSWYVERATGTRPDGVIALNLISLKDILREIGPVELPEYNEVLTDRNLAERMEFHSEIQLVPDATRPDYPTLVLQRILEKTQTTSAEKIPALLTAFYKHLESKQIFVSLADANENASLATLGWSGSLLKPACPVQLSDVPCLVDVIAQVEANVGVNKANAYIRRTTKHQVEVEENRYRHHRRTTYTNTATSQAWPKGSYKNYLRFYVALDAQLESIFIDQRPVPSNQILRSVDSGRQVYGVLVDVPINSEVTVDLNYTVPHSNQGKFAYTLFDQRQSGIEDAPTQVTLTHNPALKPTLIAPQAEVKGSSVVFNTSGSSHVFVGVQFE